MKSMIHKNEIGKLDLIKIKNFCVLKITVKKMKMQATGWEKIITK